MVYRAEHRPFLFRPLRFLVACCPLLGSALLGQEAWVVPFTKEHIQMDGRLEEWRGIESISLTSQGPGRSEGEFKQGDFQVTIRAAWNKAGLHMALEWRDDQWDIEEIPRHEAVWVAPDGSRRDRMLYYDNLRIQLRRPEFHYAAWISPRADDRGPFSWTRVIGKKGLEVAGDPPLISTRSEEGLVTMEWLFPWQGWQLKPKGYRDLTVIIDIIDSDLPGRPLEAKMDRLKALTWGSRMSFGKK